MDNYSEAAVYDIKTYLASIAVLLSLTSYIELITTAIASGGYLAANLTQSNSYPQLAIHKLVRLWLF